MSFVTFLLQKYASSLDQATRHSLTNELCEGTLPDHKLFTYLIQDLKYFELGLNMMGNALARCSKPESAVVLAKQIGFVAHDENSYFHACLEQLRDESHEELQARVPHMLLEDPPAIPEVQQYLEVLRYLAHHSQSYAEIITSMYVMEKVYLGWAEQHLLQKDNKISALAYKHKEWVDLHSGPEFALWVDFLAEEVNRVATDEQRDTIERFFKKIVDLEVLFFDGCYYYGCETA